jgi:hypothetical protein
MDTFEPMPNFKMHCGGCCCAPLQKRCPKHQGHKGDPGVTSGPSGAGGETAQVILVWVRAPGVGNASHPRRLGVMREKPLAMCSSWREDSKMLKNTSFGGVSLEICQIEWDAVPGQRPGTAVAWEWLPGLRSFKEA